MIDTSGQNERQEGDRIDYSKQIKSVQQRVEKNGRRKGRLQKLPMDEQALWRETGQETAGFLCQWTSQSPPPEAR